MNRTQHELIDELRAIMRELGEQGGIISPSIYDTAQVLRFNPPAAGVEPALAWLLEHQQADGGWGQPSVPSERTVPTLAALVALKTYRPVEAAKHIAAGVAFIRTQQELWRSLHVDLVPIAAEMIVPNLLDEAEHLGLVLDRKPYQLLYEMRRKKLERLTKMPLQANTAPAYSWEALGLPFTTDVLDPKTGIGHSPAATAAWLSQARRNHVDAVLIAQAESYLARAGAATQSDVPGLYPVVFPIRGFELTYGLYALLLTGLLDHPDLRVVVDDKTQELAAIMHRENGISFGDRFVPDVDDTGVAVAILGATGFETNPQWVQRFWYKDHFYTYAHELNPSVFSNAHALHALSWTGTRCVDTEAFLLERQTDGGSWTPDKWHTSWRSTTMEAVAALTRLDHADAVHRAAEALCQDQSTDGCWGNESRASVMETAYSVIALHLVKQHYSDSPTIASTSSPVIEEALDKARIWYQANEQEASSSEKLWLGKEAYSPVRVDRAYDISVRLRVCLDRVAAQHAELDELDVKYDGAGAHPTAKRAGKQVHEKNAEQKHNRSVKHQVAVATPWRGYGIEL